MSLRNLWLLFLVSGLYVPYVCSTTSGQETIPKTGFKLPLRRVPRTYPTRSAIAARDQGNVLNLNNVNEFVGTRYFSVVFDTGSSDLWLLSNDCVTSDCLRVPRYSNVSSSNLSISDKPFKLDYLQGSVTGVVASETVTLGSFKIVSQVFGLVKEAEDLSFSSTGNSGILGLSFPSEASIPFSLGPSLLQNIFGSLEEPYFAFKLGTQSGPNDTSSSFTFGQLDPELANSTSDFFNVPVSKAGADDYTYWKLSILNLTMNGTTIPLSHSSISGTYSQVAVLDTGTTMVLGPSDDVQTFWTFVGLGSAARLNPLSMMYEVRCDKAVEVGFVLGFQDDHREFPIDPADISWAEGGQSDGWCVGGIQANDAVSTGDWLLGDIFLRNVYAFHRGANSTHQPTIGLLSTVDKESALKAFRDDRGPDLDPCSDCKVRSGLSSKPLPSSVFVYTVSCVCGFLGGAVFTTLYRARHKLRNTEICRQR
ncbi:acid protease [Dendrothele bispora CBS 962.96]|uniref:Acid protease n=1 Tax=Dendrothele bispora (strain CBS 962.96) TaxID=1314807 RepID=A0A4S8MX06_DENBC|nr:acid protease [Dendrothele bispora CBS 962.96]